MRSCESRYRRLAPWASQRTMLSDFMGRAPGRGWGELRSERRFWGMNGAGGRETRRKKAKQKPHPCTTRKDGAPKFFLAPQGWATRLGPILMKYGARTLRAR